MIKNIWTNICHFLGFEKQKKDIKSYIYDSNIRSAIFMSAIIIILEIWLLIRQTVAHIVPEWDDNPDKFQFIFGLTGNFFLFLFIGIAMFTFAITYSNRNHVNKKFRFIFMIVSAGISFLYSFMLFNNNLTKWNNPANALKTTLIILLYAFNLALSCLLIWYALRAYLHNKESVVLSQIIVIVFALLFTIFGIRVSFSDHIRSIMTKNEIICFLTMSLFMAALLIYRPWISILTNVAIFAFFYFVLVEGDSARAAEEAVSGIFKDGDKVNYITFLFSLTTIAIMLYHQRMRSATVTSELRYNAEYDELTGLYNSISFQNKIFELEKVEETNKLPNHIVLFFNIYNFKVFNEQRGFNRGNIFLKDFAKMLAKAFPKDVVAREGGDCYIVLTETATIKEKIMSLYDEVRAYDNEVKPSFHVGGYVLKDPSEDARRIVDKARYACGTIKERQDVFYAEYDKSMHDHYHFNQYVIKNLEDAIAKEYIRPYYQPIVSAKDGKLCGFEALTRWLDPVKGSLMPGQFITTLEKTKLIHRLDAHIIELVIRDIRMYIDENRSIVPVSINLSRLDFQLMSIVDLLETLLTKYKVDKSYIKIEVTESALTDDQESLNQALITLKERGYSIWLDDFGSGYSSFNVLKDYDFELIKIDMRFLSNIKEKEKTRIILESIFRMAEALNMKTLTEGVETEAERDFLQEAKCNYLQGYLFGKAISLEEVTKKLDSKEMDYSKSSLVR